MGPIRVILNPTAGRGYGARIEPKLRRLLSEEGLDFEILLTNGPWHAAELAERASRDGIKVVVAAGGDGTTNEVMNGLMAASTESPAGTLGVIPVGTGSDFAHNVGIPPGLREACRRLAHGHVRTVDVCQVCVPGQAPRYFDNTVNIGFGGIVTVEARKIKWLRGMALYLPVVLKTVLLSRAPHVTVACDDEKWVLPAEMICVANGAREGGGFFCAPQAQPDDGLLDICIVRGMSKLALFGLVPRFMSGSHVGHESVNVTRAKRVTVSSPDDLIAHVDGEMLCTDAHEIEFTLLPQRLEVWC